ncbi:4-fold beta flower protein [uncultured Acetatifactor sp.]|uniref:4-fold beta flower protein n=1 Tax=uncultured Acetatifactor sp. TaxID=1671927 RepID=UPI0034DDB229
MLPLPPGLRQGRRIAAFRGRWIAAFRGRQIAAFRGRQIAAFQGRWIAAFRGRQIAAFQGQRPAPMPCIYHRTSQPAPMASSQTAPRTSGTDKALITSQKKRFSTRAGRCWT